MLNSPDSCLENNSLARYLQLLHLQDHMFLAPGSRKLFSLISSGENPPCILCLKFVPRNTCEQRCCGFLFINLISQEQAPVTELTTISGLLSTVLPEPSFKTTDCNTPLQFKTLLHFWFLFFYFLKIVKEWQKALTVKTRKAATGLFVTCSAWALPAVWQLQPPTIPSRSTHMAHALPTQPWVGENKRKSRRQHGTERGGGEGGVLVVCTKMFFHHVSTFTVLEDLYIRERWGQWKCSKCILLCSETCQTYHVQLLWTTGILKPFSFDALQLTDFKSRRKWVSPKILL